MAYSFVRKDFPHARRELQQVEVFPMGTVGRPLVSAAPAQANYIIEYCIKLIIPRRYRANNSTQ